MKSRMGKKKSFLLTRSILPGREDSRESLNCTLTQPLNHPGLSRARTKWESSEGLLQKPSRLPFSGDEAAKVGGWGELVKRGVGK